MSKAFDVNVDKARALDFGSEDIGIGGGTKVRVIDGGAGYEVRVRVRIGIMG